MNKAKELFDKIFVDGQEIDLQALDANHGVYSAGAKKTLKVDFVLKKKDEIPAKIFSGLTALKSVVVPETVKTIGAEAFANTGATVTGLSQVETFGDGAFIGTEITEEVQIPDEAIYGTYTAEEAAAYNAALQGAVKAGDPTEEVYINNYPNVEYIVDQQSWEDSFNNGGIMAKYYETYPDNDLIASDGSNKTATFNDRIYLGTITGEENEKRFKAGWSEKSQSLTNESDPSEVYYIERLDKTSPYYGTADEWKAQYIKFHGMSWQLYSDALLTTPVEGKEINIRTLVFNGFEHTYAAMVANGGKLPWIGAWFTEDFDIESGVHMIFKYDGEEIRPWNDRVFGKGEDQKVWGFASVSNEFNDNTLAIVDCGGEGAFDRSKFELILEKAVYTTYTEETAAAYNAGLEGAVKEGDVKVKAQEEQPIEENQGEQNQGEENQGEQNQEQGGEQNQGEENQEQGGEQNQEEENQGETQGE